LSRGDRGWDWWCYVYRDYLTFRRPRTVETDQRYDGDVNPVNDAVRDSPIRQLTTIAVVMLVPVLLLGLVLGISYRSEATRRGLAQGESEALILAQSAIQPLLNGQPLAKGLTPLEETRMRVLATEVVKNRSVQRLRLRDLRGNVIFSDDGSGFHQAIEDDALEAARGHAVVILTHLNSDSVDSGKVRGLSVEIYLPLYVGAATNRVGVLEIYLPYTPISEDVSAGIHSLYRNLAIGLALLYLVVFGISFWVGRRLRRQVRVNRFQAEHDALTGLPNRAYFRTVGQGELQAGARRGQSTTIAVIDLDRFKEVNDTLGHQNGDLLLTLLAERITQEVQLPHTVARFGGDEFGVVLTDVDAPYDTLCQLREVIQSEVVVSGLPLTVEASIGYAIAPRDGTSIDDLLQLADMAMYVAKNERSGVAGYDLSQNHYDASQLTLVAELRHAITSNQLVLHYQPKIDLRDHRVGGVEALVRWQHPQQGLLFPDRFIPLVEQTDLIDELSLWVIGQALEDLLAISTIDEDFHMAVNVSVRNLGRIGFAAQVLDALRDAQVDPQRLTVEVTETALMADPTRTTDSLTQMSDAGVRISIDDFGSGQTSLGMLANLPIAELKIDRSFIQEVQSVPEHAAIVRSMVELGHQLGLGVVAEGVETQMELAVVASTGCDVVQGYHFARPMPIAELKPWLESATSVTF